MMDTLSAGNSSDSSSDWRLIKIENAEYVISFKIVRDTWKIILSNLIELWCELLSEDSAIRRCEKLNPLLNVNAFNVKKVLQEILDDIPKHTVYASLSSIRLEATVSGGLFKFDLNLSRASTQEFWEEITKPLCQSVMELQRRQSILLDLIKRKDEEITEYKASGAELIRKNIETATFNEDLFKNTSSSTNCTSLIIDTFKAMMSLNNQIKEAESIVQIKSERLNSDSRDEIAQTEVCYAKDHVDRSFVKDFGRSAQKTERIDPGESSIKSPERPKNEEVADDDCKEEIPVAKRSPAKRPRKKDKTNDFL